MNAEDVYNKHKNLIRKLADQMRLPKRENIQKKIFDRLGNIDILFTASPFVIPDELDYLNQITYELRGIQAACRIVPEGTRDIRLICTISDKGEALELEKCLDPIRHQISDGIIKFGIEMLIIYQRQQKLLKSGVVRTPREARRLMAKEALESGVGTPLLDIIEHFEKYKDEHCRHIKKEVSEILIIGKKIITIR